MKKIGKDKKKWKKRTLKSILYETKFFLQIYSNFFILLLVYFI